MNKPLAWTLAQSRQPVNIGHPQASPDITVPKKSFTGQKLYLPVLPFTCFPLFPSTAMDRQCGMRPACSEHPGGCKMHRPCLGLVMALAGFHYTRRIIKRGDEMGQNVGQESHWEARSRRGKREQGRLVRGGSTEGHEGWGHFWHTEKRKLAGQMVNRDLSLLSFLRLWV